MTVKELIEHLKTVDQDLRVGISDYHEYWGTVFSEVDFGDFSVQLAEIDGPKEYSSQCLIISGRG
jgi:hypothetical protein